MRGPARSSFQSLPAWYACPLGATMTGVIFRQEFFTQTNLCRSRISTLKKILRFNVFGFRHRQIVERESLRIKRSESAPQGFGLPVLALPAKRGELIESARQMQVLPFPERALPNLADALFSIIAYGHPVIPITNAVRN